MVMADRGKLKPQLRGMRYVVVRSTDGESEMTDSQHAASTNGNWPTPRKFC